MCRFRREGFELSEEPDEGGTTPDSGPFSVGADAPPIRGQAASQALHPAALEADPLHVGEDTEPVPTRPVVFRLDDIARSLDPSVCPFLRRDVHGTLVAPASVPGAEQTCIAVGAPRPQSLRQQELVCLRDAHAACPRYLRGAADVSSPAGRGIPEVPRATIAALAILVLSAVLSFAFVVQRGGIAMPVVGSSPSPIAAVAAPTPPVPDATPAPVATEVPASSGVPASPSPTVRATPTLSPTPSPALTPTPAPSPSPTPARPASPTPTATPTSTRYKLLKPCPDRPSCYIYVVRSGDNLFSIANYFGHSLATIYRLNPQYPETRLRVGDRIRMPAPTR